MQHNVNNHMYETEICYGISDCQEVRRTHSQQAKL